MMKLFTILVLFFVAAESRHIQNYPESFNHLQIDDNSYLPTKLEFSRLLRFKRDEELQSNTSIASSSNTTGPSLTGSTGPSITGTTGPSITGSTGPSITGSTGPSITGTTGPSITGTTGPSITGTTGPSLTGSTGPCITNIITGIPFNIYKAGISKNTSKISTNEPQTSVSSLISAVPDTTTSYPVELPPPGILENSTGIKKIEQKSRMINHSTENADNEEKLKEVSISVNPPPDGETTQQGSTSYSLVIGILVVAALVGVAGFFYVKKRKDNQNQEIPVITKDEEGTELKDMRKLPESNPLMITSDNETA